METQGKQINQRQERFMETPGKQIKQLQERFIELQVNKSINDNKGI